MKPESSLKKSPRLIVETDKKEKKEWIEAKVASKAGNRNFSCSIVSESDVFNQHASTLSFGETPKNKIKKAKRLTLVFDISKKKYEKALISFGKKKKSNNHKW